MFCGRFFDDSYSSAKEVVWQSGNASMIVQGFNCITEHVQKRKATKTSGGIMSNKLPKGNPQKPLARCPFFYRWEHIYRSQALTLHHLIHHLCIWAARSMDGFLLDCKSGSELDLAKSIWNIVGEWYFAFTVERFIYNSFITMRVQRFGKTTFKDDDHSSGQRPHPSSRTTTQSTHAAPPKPPTKA